MDVSAKVYYSTIMSSGPPPGIDLNADIKASAIGPVIALAILATAAVGLRIMAKVASRTKLEIDDYFIFAALVCDDSLSRCSWS